MSIVNLENKSIKKTIIFVNSLLLRKKVNFFLLK
jgi:hypothetical protein